MEDIVASASQPGQGIVATVIGVIALVFGASGRLRRAPKLVEHDLEREGPSLAEEFGARSEIGFCRLPWFRE